MAKARRFGTLATNAPCCEDHLAFGREVPEQFVASTRSGRVDSKERCPDVPCQIGTKRAQVA